ncbi:GNAT family N-acetyltransferase [Desulfobotulus mexicanus]|uniref:GNAT family N-acetyltransferase n=1 Tax=Desulfobotulus mexicanus TaxID=2586642 RepID=UPI001FE2D80C|nr:GNAT family N-acetyltransferase [Desulfobotulus mexicanus]
MQTPSAVAILPVKMPAAMLDFTILTADNFHMFEKDILASEEIFPENIRESSESCLGTLESTGGMGLVAFFQDRYLGNALGFQPLGDVFTDLKLHEVYGEKRVNLIYLSNIVTLPEFQHKGFGRQLLKAFVDAAEKAGFNRVGGHFRCNGSLKNFKALGGQELASFDNWYDTGETYTYCDLALGDCRPA